MNGRDGWNVYLFGIISYQHSGDAVVTQVFDTRWMPDYDSAAAHARAHGYPDFIAPAAYAGRITVEDETW